ncbi:HCL443Cp [Eremothecium sinecaudum]|uniref:HCL443Cp n=1 Tax=Eremothecium sinecaudum TaxID=45286 RepID=A0A109UY71_9SACH|nr:HCL443Cp [Eremothecium sinecaudum]AMD19708.1 HCL443Cp [Eremothecium sinecaudum]
MDGLGTMKPSGEAELDDYAKRQQQFKLFQESLPKVNVVAYEMLLDEIVPLCMRVEKDLKDDSDVLKGFEGLDLADMKIASSHKLIEELQKADTETRDSVYLRLNGIGFNIGVKLTELLIFSNNPNLHFDSMDLLAVMKFICREVWIQVYGKQINNLKTNHRGTFYLFDYEFPPIQHMSLEGEASQVELDMVKPYLQIPCGLIRGVLASLGFEGEAVTVGVSYVDLPSDRLPLSIMFPRGVSFNVHVANK